MTLRVLVLDDDPASVGAMRRMLEHLGHDVVTATNVPEAFRQLVANKPDVAIVDLLLLNGNGFQVIEDFKREGCPCVLWTGLELPAGYSADVPVLYKPCSAEQIEVAIRNART
jgi:two-component system, response regulator RegA